MKKILIVGASGFLGSYCFKELKKMPNVEVIGTKYKSNNQFLNKIDYTNHKEFIQFLEVISPDILVWCGGLKNLSITEKNLNLALNQNFKPIKTIVSYQKTKKTLRLIFISSDYVFSGEIGDYKVSDIPKPETNYGISKLKAENHIKNHSTNFSIIRAGAIMGKDSSFLKWIVNKLKSNENIDLYDNYFSPTPESNIFEAINLLTKIKENKIYHVTGNQKLTRYEFGILIKKILKKSKSRLTKISSINNTIYLQKDLSLISSKEFHHLESLQNYIEKILAHA